MSSCLLKPIIRGCNLRGGKSNGTAEGEEQRKLVDIAGGEEHENGESWGSLVRGTGGPLWGLRGQTGEW